MVISVNCHRTSLIEVRSNFKGEPEADLEGGHHHWYKTALKGEKSTEEMKKKHDLISIKLLSIDQRCELKIAGTCRIEVIITSHF